MVGVALLGSTGSIGRSALTVLDRHRDRFQVVALTARRRERALAEQVARFDPELVVLSEGDGEAPDGWRTGHEAVIEAATHPRADVVLNAIVGAAGLEATLAALEAGKRLALANKESLVAGGPLVVEALRRGGGELIPVDSEHSAILQCLPQGDARDVERLILTASGGAFRSRSREELAHVTPEEALRHPTWDMGAKITIDSATLANKALELIEAHFLFGLPYGRLEAVVHPQSIIHSMVEFTDGSVLAQMGFPTMELPILYALSHPRRTPDAVPRFDPVRAAHLSFEPIDHDRFRMFGLGVEAGRRGESAPAVYNAANEVAVAAFLDGSLGFLEIAQVVERTLDAGDTHPIDSLAAVRAADRDARARAGAVIRELR